MANYFEVLLAGVHNKLEEQITGACFKFGASGVSEELNFLQMRDDYAPEVVSSELIKLVAYFEAKPNDEFFSYLTNNFPDIDVTLKEEENRDWMEEWKKDFVAFQLSGDYWVVPSWLEAPAEAKKILSIDPGMAFGTGTHDTTQLASDFLLEQKNKAFQSTTTVLDVGTGTGILALLAREEIAENIFCTEIDDDARVVARENFEKNQHSEINLPDYQIENIEESFDLVIANIIDGVLTKLKSDLLRTTKAGGHLLLTGILEERDGRFISGFLEETNLEVLERKSKGEWVAYLLRKNG